MRRCASSSLQGRARGLGARHPFTKRSQARQSRLLARLAEAAAATVGACACSALCWRSSRTSSRSTSSRRRAQGE
eukprot:1011416-Pyramimonas_sp.AAC.1